MPPLKLRIERGDSCHDAELAALERALLVAMKERLKLTPAIEWVAPFTLPRSEHKTRFIEVRGK